MDKRIYHKNDDFKKTEQYTDDMILRESDFNRLKKNVYNFADEVVTKKLNNESLKEYIMLEIKRMVTLEYREIIKDIVQETLKKMNNQFKEQEKRSRDLMLSIDTNIKHIVRNPELAYDTQDLIKKMCNKMIFGENHQIDKQLIQEKELVFIR